MSDEDVPCLSDINTILLIIWLIYIIAIAAIIVDERLIRQQRDYALRRSEGELRYVIIQIRHRALFYLRHNIELMSCRDTRRDHTHTTVIFRYAHLRWRHFAIT